MIFRAMNEVAKHDLTDIAKVLGVNGSVFGFVTWSGAIPILQVIALVLGIIYTVWKMYCGFINHRWDKIDRNRRLEDIEQGES